MPLRIGLTGGIASGKSTVADRFAELGIEVIDADRIARELVKPGAPLLERIRRELGEEFIDGEGKLDRRRLREHVFAHPEARARLEAILHPAIVREMEAHARKSTAPYVVLVIPLLVEKDLQDLVDRILVVDLPETEQLARVCERDRVDPEQARRILASQASREQRLAAADDVIDNAGSKDALRQAVDELHLKYLELAGESH